MVSAKFNMSQLSWNGKQIISNFLALMLIVPPISAKKLYKYEDDHGIWHYTDQPPQAGQPFQSRQLKAEPKQHVWLEKSGEKERLTFTIRNTYYGPIEAEVSFVQQRNVVAAPPLPRRFVVQPGKSDALFEISADNPSKAWQYTLEYHYTLGSPQVEHRPDVKYLPPIARDSRYQITQAFNGQFSHQDEQNRYAVDIAMPVGTPVYASRSGVVMDVENDFFKNGTEQALMSRANSVRVLHKDGSMAVYAHLALEKAQVHPGMFVKAGTLIAYSGNTGYSSGPHLHFAVQINSGMKLSSVPFVFADGSENPLVPQAGMWLNGLESTISRFRESIR